MYKACANINCGGSFSTIGARGNKRFCCKGCYIEMQKVYNKRWHAEEKARQDAQKNNLIVKPIKVAQPINRCVVKLSTPKTQICGGCSGEWLKTEAHEQYCPPCNIKLQKLGTGGYQRGDDDTWLQPQIGV